MRPQANSALPPIVTSRTAPLTFASRQRRRFGGNEVTRVPSIYISNSERDKNFHHSTKLTLYHEGSGSQTTLVEHSSALPQSETSNPRPQTFATKCITTTLYISNSFSFHHIRPGLLKSNALWRSQPKGTDQQILFSGKSGNYEHMLKQVKNCPWHALN
ncbi:unnamed protein product [Hymenolepis diminuta]|uniref:Uncharacterized protein n=1 Tax=Hymenolepis diminuta TaxID=6216 RepID=A0A0R3SZD1_HYMDI|nr:unnamed protein product [Hymenolepis diminuta]